MTPHSVARRYAHAFFDVVQKRGVVDEAARSVAAFRDLVQGHDQLRRVLETPAVPAQKKRALVQALIDAGGGTDPDVTRLLLLLADSDRLMLLPDIVRLFGERVRQARQIVTAEVVTAVPLDEAGRAALAAALGRKIGSEVTITARVDPTILGGVIARVGSQVFDGSVTRQIARMRQRLLEVGT